MVCHRTGVVVLAFLALVLLISSRADSMWLPTSAKHEFGAGTEFTSPHRQGGSVLSPTGDPDEIATVNPRGGGRMSGTFGGIIDVQPGRSGWLNDRVGVWSACLRHLVYRFQVTR